MMAYFAELNESNMVVRVINAQSLEWVQNSLSGNWIETFDDGSQRYNFASVGYDYDPIDDAFIAPAPCTHNELFLNDKKQWNCTNEEHNVIS